MHMQFTIPIDFGDKTLAHRENATLAFSVCQNFTAFFFPSRIQCVLSDMEMRKQDVGCGEGGEQKRENKSEVRGISDLSSTHNSVFKPCAHN